MILNITNPNPIIQFIFQDWLHLGVFLIVFFLFIHFVIMPLFFKKINKYYKTHKGFSRYFGVQL